MCLNDLISVIVPVYNVKKYINICVESLINQETECKYEIILVDDGSTDGSSKICDDLDKKYSIIKTYHKVNGGLSDARNYGISKASGNYYVFIDSDDYVEPKFLDVLYNMVANYHVKFACVDGIRTTNYSTNNFNKKIKLNNPKVVNKKEALKRMLLRDGFGVSAWAKIYHKSLFKDIKYPKGRLYEDMLTTPYLIGECDKVAFTGDKLYHYVVREDSITNRKVSKKDFQIFDGLYQIRDYILKEYPQLKEAYECRYLVDILGLINRVVFVDDSRSVIQRIMNKDKNIWDSALKNKFLDKRRKFQIIILKISPKLYKLSISIAMKFR